MLTSLDFLGPGKAWPPVGEEDRIKTYRQNMQLFEGLHQKVFRHWIKLIREDKQATLELILNWNKRLSLLWADLLLGEPPVIRAGELESREQQAAEKLVADNLLMETLYEVGLDVSRLGVGLLKIRFDGRAIIEGQPPVYWYPVVRPDNVKQIIAHVLAWDYEKSEAVGLGLGTRKNRYLKCEIHEPGKVTTRVYKFQGDKLGQLAEDEIIVQTGIQDLLVIPINNVSTTDRVMGLDDYTDLDGIIQELEIRVAQIGRILDKHADPNMYGPESALEEDPNTGEVVFRGSGKYFPVGEGEEPPGYVVWNGQLEAAFKQIDLLMSQLYFLSETSAACFGELKAGLAESGSALKRLMMAPLAKAARLRNKFDPAIKKALRIAADLEVAQHMAGAAKLENISIIWNDGLPDDPVETTTLEVQKYGAGMSSLESSLKRMEGLEGKELQDEMDKIEKEKPKVPSPVVTMPNADDNNTPPKEGNEA